jgi:hypothetical protein
LEFRRRFKKTVKEIIQKYNTDKTNQ